MDWSKENFTDKGNSNTKSFEGLPNINQKNPRFKSTNLSISTMNSTKNAKTKNFKGSQGSSIYFTNATIDHFNKNKNPFFNKTNNNYNKFINGSSNTIYINNEKNLDVIEMNDTFNKTNTMMEDIENGNII